jgi:hypothetical protein
LPLESIQHVRRNPEPLLGFELATSALKHLDVQTVAGLAAVAQAARDFDMPLASFRDWGVLAAPQFLGQSTVVAALIRYREEGAWGVSPHVIPHHSLHSQSGTISQVLKIHGPNLGIGGGREGTGEALLAAAAWLGRRRVPGVWVVATTLDPLTELGEEGEIAPGTECVGLALALTPGRVDGPGTRLHMAPGTGECGSRLGLLQLATAMYQACSARGSGALVISSGAPRIEIQWHRPMRPLPAAGLLLRATEIEADAARMSTGAEAER